MFKELRASFMVLLLLTAITGLAYPFALTGLAQALFPAQAAGSLVERNGRVVGSSLIGQAFTRPEYFWGRPSATTAPDPDDPSKSVSAPYNAQNSGASNLAPSAKALADTVAERAQAWKESNPAATDPIPADLLTASASGLDPHISPEAALWQARRVAEARHVSPDDVRRLIGERTEGRDIKLFGEPRVNVLALNLALDERWPMK